MAIRFVKAAVLLSLLGASPTVLGAQRAQTGAACDKACLQGIADAYLAALVARDPSKAPIAPNTKFTEQAQPMKIGEGQLWTLTTEGPTTFKIPVADPVAPHRSPIHLVPIDAQTRAAAPSDLTSWRAPNRA